MISYLGVARKSSTITMNELSNAINKLSGNFEGRALRCTTIDQHSSENIPLPDEHVAIFWIESGDTVVWCLGVVESVKNSEKIQVSHLQRIDKLGRHWVYPETAVWPVEIDQIIVRNINVIYHGASII